MAERLKILMARPNPERKEPGTDRILSLLEASRLESGSLMAPPSPAPEVAACARYNVTIHALACAAARGLKEYAAYADAVSEDEVLASLPKLSEAAVGELKADLEYIARYSPFESVRIAATFYLDE